MLPFIIIGLTSGSVFALAAVGLVLTYRTSGVFNFAYGAVAAVSAYLYYFLHVGCGIGWPVAFVVALGVVGVVGGCLLELLSRHLARVGPAWAIVATIGLILAVEALALILYGDFPRPFPAFLPTGTVEIGGVYVGYGQIITFAISLVACIGLYWFLRFSRMGVAMRAVVDDPDLVDMAGTNPVAVRRTAWIVGTTFASLAGLLLAPTLTLSANLLIMLVIDAFGAAAIGYFANMPLAYVGGLLLGVGGSVITKFAVQVPSLSGISASLPFIVLLLALLVTPRRLLGTPAVAALRPPTPSWHAPIRIRAASWTGFLAFLIAVPLLFGSVDAFTNWLIYAMLFLSLGLLVSLSGQISLGQLGFAAIGATTFAHLTGDGVPWLPAIVLAGLITVPIGALVAIPAIRLPGVFLGLATYGFAVLLEQFVYGTNLMFGVSIDGLPATRPHIWGLDTQTGYYYLVLAIVVATVALVLAIHFTRPGRLLRALADSAVALETHGASTNLTRLIVFSLSAMIAGVAGGLLAGSFQNASPDAFSSFNSLILFAVLMITFSGTPWYAFLGAAGVVLVPSLVLVNGIGNYLNLVFGVFAVAVPFYARSHRGVPLGIRRWLEDLDRRSARLIPWARGSAIVAQTGSRSVVADRRRDRDGRDERASGLQVHSLTVRYGGLVALSEVTLDAPVGRVTGLIGPNGAGKTTLFQACSGFVAPNEGAISFNGRDISHRGIAWRARHGIGRTFQRVELWPSLTVRSNIAMGREAAFAGANILSHIVAQPGAREAVASATDAAIKDAAVESIEALTARDLSLGQSRMTELARCLAGPFDLLLLDEPSSGLDINNVERFGSILQDVVRRRKVGVLLVEHNIPLVMTVCDYIYVLDAGKIIFEGTPEAVAKSDLVRNAYLGTGEPTSSGTPQ